MVFNSITCYVCVCIDIRVYVYTGVCCTCMRSSLAPGAFARLLLADVCFTLVSGGTPDHDMYLAAFLSSTVGLCRLDTL